MRERSEWRKHCVLPAKSNCELQTRCKSRQRHLHLSLVGCALKRTSKFNSSQVDAWDEIPVQHWEWRCCLKFPVQFMRKWSDARAVGWSHECRVELAWVCVAQICWRTLVSLWCHMFCLHDASAHLKSARTMWVFSLGRRFCLRSRLRWDRRSRNWHDALREFVNSIMNNVFMKITKSDENASIWPAPWLMLWVMQSISY